MVPVLVHGGETIGDSWRIALYLESQFSEGASLFGGGDAIPLSRFINSWADSLIPALARVIVVDVHDCLDKADRSYFRSSRENYFGMGLEAVVADQPAHLANLRQAFQPLRHVLKKQHFVSGTAAAYADYCVFGILMWARCCSAVELFDDDDVIVSWRERLLDAFGGLARSACREHISQY